MFYRIVKLDASLEESTVFQSPDWAAVGFEFAATIMYLSREDHLGMGEFQRYVDKGFSFNAEKYYVQAFDHPDQAHTIEGYVNGESYGEMSWGTWYNLAYYNRDAMVRAFIGKVDVTPDASDPTGETWG